MKDWNNLGFSGTVETFFTDKMYCAPLCTLKCMCDVMGVGRVGGPHLVLLCCFFQDKAKRSLLAGRPCPLFSLAHFPHSHREVWLPEFPVLAPLRPALGATSEVSSLSEHAFPCSKPASGRAARTEQIE